MSLARRCSRTACGRPAVNTLTYVYADQTAVLGPLATFLIKAAGVQTALSVLGAAYFAVVVGAAQFLRPAPEHLVQADSLERQIPSPAASLTLKEALRTPHWYLLWSMLALNVTAGAALISVAAPLAHELTGVGAALGALAVAVISLFNSAGRLLQRQITLGRPL